MARCTSGVPELYVDGDSLTARFTDKKATFLPGMGISKFELSTGEIGSHAGASQAIRTAFIAVVKPGLSFVDLIYKDFDSAHRAQLLLSDKAFFSRKLKAMIIYDMTFGSYTLHIWQIPRQLGEKDLINAVGPVPPVSTSIKYKAWQPLASLLSTTVCLLVREVTGLSPFHIERLNDENEKELMFVVYTKECGIRLSALCDRLTGHTIHGSMQDLKVMKLVAMKITLPSPMRPGMWMRLTQVKATLAHRAGKLAMGQGQVGDPSDKR